MRVTCDPRFKWLSVVTIYVVCIVCLLDACPLPPSQLDHNTCASNPEQANAQVKIPFIIDPQKYFQINFATIPTRRFFVYLSLHTYRFYYFHCFLFFIYFSIYF